MTSNVEVLLVLMAWAAIFGLFVVVPWIVVRAVVGLLEADVGTVAAERFSTAHGPAEAQGATTRSGDEKPTPDEPRAAQGKGRS